MKVLRRIHYILTLRCEEASRLASERLDRPLTWYERAALRGHQISCWSCRHFANQLQGIRDACQVRSTLRGHEGLSDTQKQRLEAALRSEQDD